MTLERLASIESIEKIVGGRPTARWNRSSPFLKRSDGHSRETWFKTHTAEQRVRLVREFLLDQAEWHPLLRFEIPKVGKSGHRSIDVPTVLGQAAQYVIHEWFRREVERHLNNWCLGYRHRKRFDVSCRQVHRMLSRRPWAQPLDVVDFFGSIRHAKLDTAIDRLDADDALKGALSRLWRVPDHRFPPTPRGTASRRWNRPRFGSQSPGLEPLFRSGVVSREPTSQLTLSRRPVLLRRWVARRPVARGPRRHGSSRS